MPHALNVLFIIADQFRADCLGAAGNPIIQTPHLDALAEDGTLFPKAFVQTAPCGPSRMSIFTGRYMCSTRAVNNMTPMTEADDNLAVWLRAAGYAPALMGYNDYAVDPRLLPDGDPRKHSLDYDNFLPGFDVPYAHEFHSPEYFELLRAKGYPEAWCGSQICTTPDVPEGGPDGHLPLHYPARYRAEDSEAAFLTDRALEYIRARRDTPWFLSLNYIKPHPPRVCPAPYHSMHTPEDMPPPARHPDELESEHPFLALSSGTPQLSDEQDWRETRACYYGMIAEIDACVGRLVAALQATGQWEETLIVFTSDHGDYLGDHYLDEKGGFYDGALRVPLIIRDPSSRADATRGTMITDGFAESVDLTPTVLDYVGAVPPDRIQGRSLLAAIRGDRHCALKDAIHYEYDFRGTFRHDDSVDPDACLLWVIRDDAYKYVHFGLETMPPLLFDLRADPMELENLADHPDHAETVARYAGALLRWRMRNEDQRMEHWASRYR